MTPDPKEHGTRLDRRAVLGGAGLVLAGLGARATTPGAAFEAKALGRGYAFNGVVPGPTLRIRLGETLTLPLVNRLAAPTGILLDGVRSAAAAAGTLVSSGGTTTIRVTPPDAGTFQYHAAGPDAAGQTAGGMRGVLIVDEPVPPSIDADLLLALGDGGAPDAGMLVNGSTAAMTATVAPGARVRLRLVNGCVARVAIVALDGVRPSVVAVDGQPSALFEPAAGMLPIGPGARFDVMFDVPPTGGGAALRGGMGHPDVTLLKLTTAGKTSAARAPIAALPENSRLPARIALERAARHTVTIADVAGGHWTMTGNAGPSARPLFTIKRGNPIVLTLDNRSASVQPFQVAGQCWRILHDLDDGWDPYWRNTLLLAPGKAKHVAFVPYEAGRWALESSDLVRRAAGLAASFEVR